MTTPELLQSWERTRAFLRDATNNLSEFAQTEYFGDTVQIEEYIEHNELGLAFDVLESIAIGSYWESSLMLENLALAAANMGLTDKVQALDEKIGKLRGSKHKTRLPSTDT